MIEQIVSDPEVCNGRPIIAGTRITAQTIFEFLAAGDSVSPSGLALLISTA